MQHVWHEYGVAPAITMMRNDCLIRMGHRVINDLLNSGGENAGMIGGMEQHRGFALMCCDRL